MRALWLFAACSALTFSLPAYGLSQVALSPIGADITDIYTLDTFVDSVLSPAELDLRPIIIHAVQESEPLRGITLIEEIIPRLSEDSKLRIFLLTQRAALKVSSGDIRAGRAEFEALMQQFPQVGYVKLEAIDSLAYGKEAEFAVRQWIDLAASNPAAARSISGYTMGAMVGNLDTSGNSSSASALFLALDRIGYDPGTAALRNQMQLAIFVNAANDDGRENQATSALRKLTNPEVLLSLASQSRYQYYWEHIALDAKSLNAGGAAFLRELEKDFLAAENGVAAGRFLSAAVDFGDAQVVAKVYSQLLSRLLKDTDDSYYAQYDTPFWVSPIAFAWLAAGNPGAAEQQFKAALNRHADVQGTINLNISANYARLLLEIDRPREALALIDPAIAELTYSGGAAAALAQMHLVRLRAYHQLGKLSEASDSRRYLNEMPTAYLDTYVDAMLLIGEEGMAKEAIIKGLRSYNPQQAIKVLQYPLARTRNKVQAECQRKLELLRHDKDVLAALAAVGRIVPIVPIDAGPFDHVATADAFSI